MNKSAVFLCAAIAIAIALAGCTDLARNRIPEPENAGFSSGGTTGSAVEIVAPTVAAPGSAPQPPAPMVALPRPDRAVGEAVTTARVLRRNVPGYPSALAEQGIEGTVVATFQVDAAGIAEQVRIVSSPHPQLSQVVTRALAAWRFEPARDADGRAVRSAMRLPFRFVAAE